MTSRRYTLLTFLFLMLAGFVSSPSLATAQKADRPAVAKCLSATGSLIRREAPDRPWQLVKQGEPLRSGDLILGLPGAVLESRSGDVELTFRSDLGGITPFPIVESAIVLHDSKDVDLDFRLDRGRVECTSRKKKGEVHFRSRIREEAAGSQAILEPGASCALEIFGRWPAGGAFVKNPKPGYSPTLHVIFIVVKGEITLKLDKHELAMKAPPGPALIEWDSVSGGDPSPQRLDKLPEWAGDDPKSELALKRKAAIEQFRKLILEKPIDAVLDELVNADDPVKRRLAVNAMGALDQLKHLGTVMATTKHADVWEHGVLALRHWIGRGPGQDQKLYQALVTEAKYSPIDAESVLQLLHSFGETELARPETYDMLIDYLAHDRLAIRGLAHWHLVRLVPAGKKYGYSPMAAKDARDKALAEWRKLVPHGKLPPKPEPPKP